MSRRSLGAFAIAATMLGSGLVPLLGTAHAGACASWTDPAGDSYTANDPTMPPDDNMDIVAASLSTVGDKIVGVIKVKDLAENGYSDVGDQFVLQLSTGGTSSVKLVADRDETKVAGRVTPNTGTGTQGAATVSIDQFENTVTITTTVAEVDKVAGKPTKDVESTTISASTYIQLDGDQLYGYDSSNAPAGTKYTIGAPCSPEIPAPAPLATPEANCFDITDAPNDGIPTLQGTVATQNDSSLDISWAALNTTPTNIYAYLKIASLKTKPANWQGDRFDLTFKHGGKTYVFSVGRIYEGKSISASPTRGQVNGTTNTKLRVYGTFDLTKSMVIIDVPRAPLDEVHGAAVPDGTSVTDVAVKSLALIPNYGGVPADTAQDADAAKRTYTIGSGKCFGPPPSKMVNVGAVTSQFTDAASLAAKLTTEAGQAIAGKSVRFTISGKSVTATTGSDGVARASLAHGLAAGSYQLVTAFAGDTTAKDVSITTPFSVTEEKTKMTLTVVRSGTKRTVTAKLLDDDNKAVARQAVALYVNGKKVATRTTSTTGVVTLSAVAGQTVQATFTKVTGRYLGSTARMKV